jgi:hypothetical protein
MRMSLTKTITLHQDCMAKDLKCNEQTEPQRNVRVRDNRVNALGHT